MTVLNEMAAVARARRALASGEGRKMRERNHLSLEECGRACNVDASTVFRWETGEHLPRTDHALRYARFLDQMNRLVGA